MSVLPLLTDNPNGCLSAARLARPQLAFIARMGMSKTNTERFVGIDVAKDTLDVFIDPLDTQPWQHLAYDAVSVTRLAEQLRALAPTLIVMEATGGLETRLACELVAHGLPVAVVNPRQVRDFARARGELAKTDRLDARVLCEFARLIRPAPRGVPDAATRELAELLGRRRQLVEMRMQETQRSHQAASKPAQKSLKAHIAWLDKRIKDIDADLHERLRTCDAWRAKDDLLRSIPGVGEVNSFTMMARCPEIGQLNRRQIAKLVGTAPLACDSGKYRGKRRIWGGRGDVRKVLYMGTVSAIQHNPTIKVFADRLKAAGKPPKVVIVACMRKLLTIMNVVIKTNTPWNPAMNAA
jgi:transposase